MNNPYDECSPPLTLSCLLRLECKWYRYCREKPERGESDEPECETKPFPDDCGTTIGNPNRPGRPQGKDSGRLNDPTPLTKGDLNSPNPPGVWVGPRKDLCLPFLFMRANPGDLGKRPVVGPFWESPDIMILAGVPPELAPPIPPKLGEIALANQPNTIYAHVWNFGNGKAAEVIVEFYWCDPSLGINSASTHLIAQTPVALGAKGSGRSHALVKCPKAWTPTFLNGGHECLLVRIWDNPSDVPGEPKLDASINRHVAQRNIHVVASGAAAMPMMMSLSSNLSLCGTCKPTAFEGRTTVWCASSSKCGACCTEQHVVAATSYRRTREISRICSAHWCAHAVAPGIKRRRFSD